jgi:cytidine deaminase
MLDKEFEVLKEVAKKLAGDKVVSNYVRCGHVACALLTDKGNVYTGISINAKCGIGFCAEHSAIADMLKAGESKIVKLVSASENSVVVPCGRCLEFIRQVNDENINAKVLLGNNEVKTVDALLPVRWNLNEL